jgi:hypothetical protein
MRDFSEEEFGWAAILLRKIAARPSRAARRFVITIAHMRAGITTGRRCHAAAEKQVAGIAAGNSRAHNQARRRKAARALAGNARGSAS